MDWSNEIAQPSCAQLHSCPDWGLLPGSAMVCLVKHMEKAGAYQGLFSMLGVCKAWHSEIASNLEALHLNYVTDLAALGREFNKVKVLDLAAVTVGPGLTGISSFTNLRSLELNGVSRRQWGQVDDGSIVRECLHLPHLTRLEGLVCGGGLSEHITRLTGLVRLSFCRFVEHQIQDSALGLRSLPLIKSLESLSIVKSTMMTGLVDLSGCTLLTSLSFHSCSSFLHSNITAPPNLRALKVEHTADFEFDFLTTLTGLTRVESLGSVHMRATGVPQVSTLVHLGLYCGFRFRREDMGVTMHGLTRLDALYAHKLIEADILDHLAFPRLKRLSVSANNVQDDDFQNLTCLTGLESLMIGVAHHQLSRYGPMCLMELVDLTRLVFFPSVQNLDEDCVDRLFCALPKLSSFSLDFSEIMQEAKDELSREPGISPLYLGTGKIGNPLSPSESRIGGSLLRLAGEEPMLCSQCGSRMVMVFQLNYGDMPEQARRRFGANVLQLLACSACPCAMQLRLLTRRAIERRGFEMEAPVHILPWGAAKCSGLRPMRITSWAQLQDTSLQFSPQKIQKMAQKYDIDQQLWPLKLNDFEFAFDSDDGTRHSGLCRVGGRRLHYLKEHLGCDICHSNMDLVAANVNIPPNFLDQSVGTNFIIYCCRFHTEQMVWRFYRFPHDMTLRGEVVDIP